MLVTVAVLNSGTFCRLEQPLNIALMSVTAAVLNNGTFCKLEQLLNILLMFVTVVIVLAISTFCKLRNK